MTVDAGRKENSKDNIFMLETEIQCWPTPKLARQIKPISTINRVHEQLSVKVQILTSDFHPHTSQEVKDTAFL